MGTGRGWMSKSMFAQDRKEEDIKFQQEMNNLQSKIDKGYYNSVMMNKLRS